MIDLSDDCACLQHEKLYNISINGPARSQGWTRNVGFTYCILGPYLTPGTKWYDCYFQLTQWDAAILRQQKNNSNIDQRPGLKSISQYFPAI